jgi:NADH-quinone oxidoreductase subunit M
MSDWPLLSLVTFLPLLGVVFIIIQRGEAAVVARSARYFALWFSLATFVLSLWLWIDFDPTNAGFQFVERARWITIGGVTINYHMGIDGISLFFVLLSTLLTVLCVGASWNSVHSQVKEYMIAFLVLETMMVGVFCALDFVLFYVFFEGVLVPMFLIIGVWGGTRRVYAAFKFFLYTLLGSVLSLLAILAVYFQTGSTDIAVALTHSFPTDPINIHFFFADFSLWDLQKWLWLAFFASFAVKVPMWPVHTWLPDAHVEAPTAGSVILAGVLLKLGGYGFIRFSLPMFPLASAYFTPLMFALSAIAVIYTSFVALAQTDMKKLIAYSSIAHMGFVTMGLFALTSEAVQGAMIQMLSHGLVSAGLFLVVGVVYDRLHTRDIDRYSGLVERMPAYAFVFMCLMLASVGLPGTSGFVGEFLILLGTFRVSTLECFLAATALFLGPMYMLYLYRRVIFGTITRADLRGMLDLSPREMAVFAPLLVLVLWMGVYPSSFLIPISASVDHLVAQVSAAQQAARRASTIIPALSSASASPDTAFPARAGIHPATLRAPDEWVPAFAGMTGKGGG